MVSKGWSALRDRAARGPGAQFIKLKNKESATIHFLVKSEDDAVFFRQHYNDNKYFICEDDSEDLTGNCRYCNASDKKPSTNYAFNVLDRGDGKVKILALNTSHAQAVLDFIDEYGSLITFDYKIKRSGDGAATRYNFVPMRPIKKWDVIEKKAYEERYNLEEYYDPEKKNPKAAEKPKKKKIQDEIEAAPASVKKTKAKKVPDDE